MNADNFLSGDSARLWT